MASFFDDDGEVDYSENYDAAVNLSYLQKYQTQTNIVDTLVGGATAAVVDFGASVWNSLPATPEVETYDLLTRISPNAAQVYAEHPDAIQAASFIGGVFVPGGLALKGMNALRAGQKGATWFSEAGRLKSQARLDELFREGPKSEALYKAAKREMLARNVGNQLLDAAAMEMAVIGAMNAHPFMEDYWENPVKNFGISLALGGAIGGGIGHIADRAFVRSMEREATAEALGTIFESYKRVEPALPYVNKVQTRQQNIEYLKKFAASGDPENLLQSFASKVLQWEQAQQVLDFQDLGKALTADLTKPQADALMLKLAEDSRFQGTDAIDFLSFKEAGENKTFKTLQNLKTSTENVFSQFFDKKGRTVVRGYSPEFDSFGTRAEIAKISRANSIGWTPAKAAEGWKDAPRYIQAPDNDAAFKIFSASAPEVDSLYLRRLIHIDKLKPEQLAKAAVAPDDIFTLNALVARAVKEPDVFKGMKIKLTKQEPNYEVMQQAVFKYNGVKADHHVQMAKFTNPKAIKQYDLFNASDLSSGARDLLYRWRNGPGVAEMRLGADSFFRGGYGAMGQGNLGKLVGEMYNSASSKALRDQFRALADEEGNVYLWRGMKKNPRGHAALESYTTDIQKAREFGSPRLFKVHVDDILGSIADLKSKDGLAKNEIIVGSPARQIEASLPIAGVERQVTSGAKLASTTKEISIAEAATLLQELKEDLLTSMLQKGVPFEVMAIRTNTPPETVKAWAAAGGSKRLFELEAEGLKSFTYDQAENIDQYLSKLDAPLRLRTNKAKVPFAELSAALDRQALDKATREIISDFLTTSPSSVAREIGEKLFSSDTSKILDILRSQVTYAVNEAAGSKFFQSTDFFVRNMKDFGKIASWMGKEVQGIANRQIQRILKPIGETMEGIATDRAALVEVNDALAFNAKLRGYRLYQDRQFLQKAKVLVDGEEVEKLVPALRPDGSEFKIIDDKVDTLFTQFAAAGEELYAMKNTANKIQGIRDLPSIGFWVPPFNPKSKHIAYVWNKIDDSTTMLWGNTTDELKAAVAAYKAAKAPEIAKGSIEVIEDKAEQELKNIMNARDDQIHMGVADLDKFHSGASAPAIVKYNTDIFGDIVQGYEHYIQASVRNLAELSMHDITDILKRMSDLNTKALKNQPLSAVQRFTQTEQDTAAIMRNTLLGVSNLKDNSAWYHINQSFETVLGISADRAGKLWKDFTAPFRKGSEIRGEAIRVEDYKKLSEELAARGIHNPWEEFDKEAARLFGVASLVESKNVSQRAVYAGNALAATVALRFGEVAQPIVNAMSLPILTMSAMSDRLPATFMGVTRGTAKAHPVQLMMEGVRAAFGRNPQHLEWAKQWEKAGYFEPLVSEATDLMRLTRQFEPGIVSKTEGLLNSDFVRIMSKLADSSEGMVRRIAMFTGGNMAKRLYPELDDVGVTIFARDFMDKTIGNYHASQRPTMFQGTLGVAMGLFQTYMVTMAQSLYRHLEMKNFKAIAATMLTQQTIFGAGSLPGFHAVSNLIGEHFSDDNVDLVTGTFRALPDPMADLVLYGMPSSFGPAFYTRGELAPRVPAGVGEFPSVNMAAQTIEAVMGVARAVGQENEEAGRAIAQALSMQSLSRPLARISELASGYSVTRQGNTIATPEEVWTPVGVMSRLMSMRPLEEAKLRDAIHLNTFYGSLDREARQKLMGQLKTAIRNGTLDDEQLAEYAEEYLRTGTPSGWRSALNTAIAQTEVSGKVPLLNKMKPENPLNFMIDSLDGE